MRPRPQRRPMRRMLISPTAVKDFLDRELDDWRWIKEVPRAELEACVEDGFEFITSPRLHQLACFVLGQQLARFLYFLDMGSGKTKLLLDLIRLRKYRGELNHALVSVPNVINLASWERQLSIHAPDLSVMVLDGSREERYTAMDAGLADVCLINNAGLSVYMASGKRITKKGNTKKVLVAEDALQFSDCFNFFGIDECHNGLSTVGSLQYDEMQLLSRRADFCYGMTGTPFGRTPEKLWPQYHVVDQGETMGHSLGLFHAAYYKEKYNHFKRSGVEYVFDKTKHLRLRRTIQHRSLRYQDHEFADLPMLMPPIQIPVQMSPQQIRRNTELVEQARQDQIEGERRGNIFIRQRQTAAGFLAVREDDLSLEVEFSPNPKIDALEQFLKDLNEDEKLVIYHDYVPSGAFIQALLTKMKIGYSGVGHGFRDAKAQLKRFMEDWRTRVFVANCKAGGTGVDGLQEVCRYGLFYETPTSPTARLQAVKRLHRDGQKRRVFIYDLVAQGINIDQRVHKSLATGSDLFNLVLNGKERIT